MKATLLVMIAALGLAGCAGNSSHDAGVRNLVEKCSPDGPYADVTPTMRRCMWREAPFEVARETCTEKRVAAAQFNRCVRQTGRYLTAHMDCKRRAADPRNIPAVIACARPKAPEGLNWIRYGRA